MVIGVVVVGDRILMRSEQFCPSDHQNYAEWPRYPFLPTGQHVPEPDISKSLIEYLGGS